MQYHSCCMASNNATSFTAASAKTFRKATVRHRLQALQNRKKALRFWLADKQGADRKPVQVNHSAAPFLNRRSTHDLR